MTMTLQNTDSIVADACFPALRDHIISSTGLVFYADRPDVLAGHVADRLKKQGLSGCVEYWELLQDEHAGEAELDQLIALLTIGETYFFRHRELFDALRDVALPEIIERNRATKRLRVWSAGCSTGPEAYSVSILLRRELGHAVQGWNISIVGTDINRPFLSQAAAGRYEEWAFRGTSPEFRRECFEEASKSWQIAPRFREGVTFQYHNLARHPFPSLVQNLLAFDLILCRNVLIYFAPEIVGQIISQLAECLVPNGWLAVGHAEHGAHLQSAFDTVDCRGTALYRRLEPSTRQAILDSSRLRHNQPVHPTTTTNISYSAPSIQQRAAGDGGPHNPRRVGPPPAACEYKSRMLTPCPEVGQIRRLADQGDLNSALQLCDSLIARNRLNPVGYYYQALLLDQAAGHDAALDALGKAIYLNRDFDLAHYYLGLTQQKLGDAACAIKSFHNVLKLLEDRDRSERLPDAEGMTVADLEELTRIHLETLEIK
ncbi:MAG: CheR family methyltransferase [Pirellulales bacterium]